MGLFDNVNVQTAAPEEVEVQEERVGGGAKVESGCYEAIIKMANLTESQGGAIGVKLSLETEDGISLTMTEYITSGTEKGVKTYYEKDGKKFDLPGYAKIKGLNYLLNNVDGEPTNVEEREIKEYDYEAKAEITVRRRVILDFIGKPIGICLAVVNEDDYRDTTKSRIKKDIRHFFDPVTGKFKGEKMGNAEAENKQKFLDRIPEDGIFDDRKNSKGNGAATTTSGTTSGTNAADTF